MHVCNVWQVARSVDRRTLLPFSAHPRPATIENRYDVIGTLCDAVGSEMAEPEHVAILMPPLLEKWSALDDDSAWALNPLLHCFTCIAGSLRGAFAEFAEPL